MLQTQRDELPGLRPSHAGASSAKPSPGRGAAVTTVALDLLRARLPGGPGCISPPVEGPWLHPSLVVLQAAADSAEALVDVATTPLSVASGLDPDRLRRVFAEALRANGFSLGSGVAIPHVALDELSETLVCLVTLQAPLPMPSIDDVAPDVFFFILTKRDPRGHLALLAHLAALARSRALLAGLREAQTVDEVIALVDAAERRARPDGRTPDALPTTHVLVLVSVSGERLVDEILVELVDRGLDDATVIEALSLREAATKEVPLFAGFRDIFGDPGGRRLLIVEAPVQEAPHVVERIRQLCEEHGTVDVAVTVLPVQLRWRPGRTEKAEERGAH